MATDGQAVNGVGKVALGAAHHVLHGAHCVAILAVNGLELAAQGLDLHILGLAVLAVLAALVQKSGVLVQLLPGFDHPVDGALDVGILHGPLALMLCGQLLFHLVEGFDVLQLPLYGLLPVKPIASMLNPSRFIRYMGYFWWFLRVGVFGLEEHRGVPIFGEALDKFLNIADNVVMAFAEALGDIRLDATRLAVLGG